MKCHCLKQYWRVGNSNIGSMKFESKLSIFFHGDVCKNVNCLLHHNYVIMSAMASQIAILTIVYWTVHSGTYERKDQSSASLAFVRGIHRWPVNSPHKGSVTRKMSPFDDVIMIGHFDQSSMSWHRPVAIMNTDYLSQIRLMPESRKISFIHGSFYISHFFLQFCTEHGNYSAVLCSKMQTDSSYRIQFVLWRNEVHVSWDSNLWRISKFRTYYLIPNDFVIFHANSAPILSTQLQNCHHCCTL